jgi:hypothetical protein
MANRNRKPGAARRGPTVVVPFPVHQILDYLAGLYLLQVGSHLRGRAATVCYVAGAVILVAAVFSGRPLGGGPISRPLHRVVDVVIILGVAAAPFVFDLTGNASDVLRFEGVAVLLIVIVRFTNYVRPQPGATSRAVADTAVGTARLLKAKGPRAAGRMVGRRLAPKNRPPGDPS